MTEADRLRAQGLEVNTVADILGDLAGAADSPPASAVPAPTVEGCHPFPEPGIYFGMPDEVYQSIVACSASGLKDLSASAMTYWAKSRMNPDREDDDTEFKAMGRAFHCRICEGREAFAERYYVELDQADYQAWPEEITDEMRSALSAAADAATFAEEAARLLPLCITVDHLRKAIDICGSKAKGTAKGPMIGQLVELCHAWPIWDLMVGDWAEANEGKLPVSAKTVKRIEIAAAMIEKHPDLKDTFRDGHAEVSLFWYCPRTGVPMKAKLDYLKMNAFIDLKTFSNPMGKPVQRAVDAAISNGKHYLPVVVYHEGIAEVKRLVRESKGECIYRWIDCGGHGAEEGAEPCEGYADSASLLPGQREWAWTWAHQPEPEALYLYQMTGVAPVTIGRLMVRGTTFTVNEFAVQWLKRKWRKNWETYGTSPWIDIFDIERTVDESLQWSATDFGDQP